jgi:acyl-CoA reductase-like NAD-dependent aldehyde dehydrogenase
MTTQATAPQLPSDLYIAGKFETGQGERIPVENPATEETFTEVASASIGQVHRAVSSAQMALTSGALGTAADRSRWLLKLADLIEEHAEEIVSLVVTEAGTPISTARALHIGIPVETFRYMATAALVDRTEHLGRRDGPPANEGMVLYRPAGVVAGITAYNVPLMFAATKAGAALAAGCPTVLLPSPQAPLSTLFFARLLEEAGLPPGAVNIITGGVDVAQALISAPDVARVSFTGSVPAGIAVMKAAADGLTGVVLELGGKSAAIILPSADPGIVAAPIHQRYLRNAGQGCAAPTRILVPESRLADFVQASRDVYSALRIGDPWDPETLIGPVISGQHRQRVLSHIQGALDEGGSKLAVGNLPEGKGHYVAPTLIGGLSNDARINQEEIFGPVGTVIPYRDVDDAVRIANESSFGLHASIFGATDEALELAPRMHVGHVTINGGGALRADLPNGGWNKSGIGREFGEEGVREFLEPVAVQWTV